MTKVIIDCDPGHDDALAILLAGQHLDILGITTVAGNQTLDKVTANALKIVELMDRTDIPVFRGGAGPAAEESGPRRPHPRRIGLGRTGLAHAGQGGGKPPRRRLHCADPDGGG